MRGVVGGCGGSGAGGGQWADEGGRGANEGWVGAGVGEGSEGTDEGGGDRRRAGQEVDEGIRGQTISRRLLLLKCCS